MKLSVVKHDGSQYEFRHASQNRDWMDATFSNHAYRCVPLTNANSFGWEIVIPTTVVVRKNDEGIVSIIDGEEHNSHKICGTSIENESIAFYPRMSFITQSGYSLLCMQSPNTFVDGAQAYTAIIPSSWWAEAFQFSWRINKTNQDVIFPAGSSIMFITPVDNLLLEKTEIEIVDINNSKKTQSFIEALKTHMQEFADKKWKSTMRTRGILGGCSFSDDWHIDNPHPPKKIL